MDRRKVLTIALLGLLIATSIVINAALVTSKYYSERIHPNTIVGGIALGGLRHSEARSLIYERASRIINQELTLQLGGSSAVATARSLGVVVDDQKTFAQITPTIDNWSWARIGFWRDFFSEKNVTFSYSINEEKLTQTLDEKFPVPDHPIDAAIVVKDGNFEVKVASAGVTIDLADLKDNLVTLVKQTTAPTDISVNFTKTPPNIDNVQAETIKADAVANLAPLYLSDGNNTVRLEARRLYPHVSFSNVNNSLTWSVPESSIREFIRANVSPRFNIKMRQRTVMADTREITDQGQEGREVLINELAALIARSIREKSPSSAEAPIVVPIRTIAITERTITPAFVLGIYTGRYLMINLREQKLFAIDGNVKVAEFRVSTGKWSTPTPRGTFYIKNKAELAFSREFRLWLPLWNALAINPDGSGYQGYGIHGLPCFNRDCTRREGVNHIGTPVSAGCIRLSDEGSRFIFDWAPVGTPVVIQ